MIGRDGGFQAGVETASRDAHYDDTLSTLEFWRMPSDERDAALADLRARLPISWQPQMDVSLEPRAPGKGFWAIVDYDHVEKVARNSQVFRAGDGITIDDIPRALYTRTTSFLAMDAPEHTRVRRVVSAAFTPRQVARGEELIRRRASQIVDELLDRGPCDFVEHVAKPLPVRTISEMLGVSPEDEDTLSSGIEAIIGRHDPAQYGTTDRVEALVRGLESVENVARAMARYRREHPGDDLLSNLVTASVDGESLSEDEVVAAFVLLAMAGHDTTRHTTSIGMRALCENPDQRRALISDMAVVLPSAINEMLRWATVVMNNRRTAAARCQIDDVVIEPGEKVVLVYYAANRDPQRFDDPHDFRVSREPNPHVAFGGGGPHYCLGASLAKSQLKYIFHELLSRIPTLEVGAPERLVSPTINGIVAMECSW